MDCTIYVAKTKALISFAVTVKLICVFVFAYANIWFSHDAAHLTLRVITVCFQVSKNFAINGKVPKFWDTINLCCNLPKIQTKRFAQTYLSENLRSFSSSTKGSHA